MATTKLANDENLISMLNWCSPGSVLQVPNGVPDQGDWQTFLDLYGGILWNDGSSIVILPGNIVTDIIREIMQPVFG